MFRTRLLSGILLVIIALATIMAGDGVLAVVLCLVSLIAFKELTRACGVHTADADQHVGHKAVGKTELWLVHSGGHRLNAPERVGMVMTILYYTLLFLTLNRGGEFNERLAQVYPIIMIAVTETMIVFLFTYVFTFPRYKASQIMASMFSWIYAPLMLSFIYLTREGFEHGNYLVWFIFLCSWGSDTCAYAVGVLIGKHKMTPKLSPKKSVEGAVGGIVGAALLFVLYTHFAVNRYSEASLSLLLVAALGAAGAVVSMIGDLAASAIKRDHDIKDYGKLIPGHGGIMDRFDSVIIAAPLVFIGLIFII